MEYYSTLVIMKHGFKDKVYQVVSVIPKGKTMSYKKVAYAAGHPHAYRAVGTIMSHNMNPLIPCHRVIKSDGTLGGYNRGGQNNKKDILQREGVTILRCTRGYKVIK